jgi:hypothetical protein
LVQWGARTGIQSNQCFGGELLVMHGLNLHSRVRKTAKPAALQLRACYLETLACLHGQLRSPNKPRRNPSNAVPDCAGAYPGFTKAYIQPRSL